MERPLSVAELDHVVLRCRDQARMLDFYTRVLGLHEERVGAVIGRLEEIGALAALDPGLGSPAEPGRSLFAVREALTWFARLRQRDKPDRNVVLLGGLLAPLGPERAGGFCAGRLRYSAPKSAMVAVALREAPVLARECPGLRGPLWRHVSGVPVWRPSF